PQEERNRPIYKVWTARLHDLFFCSPRRRRPRATPKGGGLRPLHLGRQGHQDGLRIAAGLQAEGGAAIIEQVELHIAAAATELVLALLLRPVMVHVAADDLGIDIAKRPADVLGEGEVLFPVAFQPVIEDAADAARLVAVRQEEILIAPFLVARIKIS